MSPSKIIVYLCDQSSEPMTLSGVLSQAFETTHPIELLRKRALFIEHCVMVMDALEFEEAEREAMYDIFDVLAFKNLGIQIKDLSSKLTKAHKASAISMFKYHDSIKRDHDVDEIVQISDELREAIKEEEISPEQEAVLLSICDAVTQSKEEHSIAGNSAIQKLYEVLMGKVILYQDEIMNIKSSKIKALIGKLYAKTHEVNKVMGFVLSLKKNVSGLLDLIGLG